jgi:hypothetical protein
MANSARQDPLRKGAPVVTPAESFWSERRWERLAPLSGVVAVVLFVVGFIVFEVVGDTPDGDAGAEQYLSYFREEDGSIWGGSWLFALGIFFFLWFLGSLRAALYRAEGGVGRVASIAYAGGVGGALLLLASLGTQASGAIAADENRNFSAQAAEALWWAGDGFFVGSTFFLAALFAATAVLTVRTRLFPLWFGIVSAIFALASLIVFISWAVVIFATPLWILFVAVWLATRPRVPAV